MTGGEEPAVDQGRETQWRRRWVAVRLLAALLVRGVLLAVATIVAYVGYSPNFKQERMG